MTFRLWGLALAVGFVAPACSGASGREASVGGDSVTVTTPASTGAAGATDLDSLIAAGESAYGRAEFDSARVLWGAALPVAERARDTARQARILTGLGLVARQQGEYGESRALGERALALKLKAGLHPDLFRSYNALGLLAWNEGRLEDAIQLFQHATEAAGASGDTASLVKVVNNLALVHVDLGNFAQARTGFLEARRVSQRLGDTFIEGRALNNLGMLDAQMGDPGSAVAALTQARVLYRSTGDRAGEQNALGQLGTAYDALGEPHLAFAALDSALQLSRQLGLRQEEASNLELIAGLHRQAGDLPRALQLYAQANLINGELGLPEEQGTNLRNAAEIHAVLGRPDLARENALEALRLHRTTGVRLHELRDLLLLADLAAAAGTPREVDGHLGAAERLSTALDARIARVEVALARATIADRAGDSRGVLRALHAARQDLALGGFGGEWQSAALQARAYARLSRLDSAVAAGRAAVAAVERVRGSFGSAVLRASFASDKAAPYTDLVEILLRLGRTEEAFEVADGARSHALLENLAATRSEAELSRATVRTLAKGEATLRRIDTLVSRLDVLEEIPPAERGPTEREQVRALATDLFEARGAYEALLVQVAERDAAGTTLLGGRRTRAEDVKPVLLGDEAVLEYLVTPTRAIVFVVTRGEVRSLATEIQREDLARQVRLARDLLGERGPPTNAHAEVLAALHAELVAPIERAGLLEGVRRLIVVPHSVLAYLPFAALRREGTEQYLVEDYALLHLPSAAALGVLRGSSGLAPEGPPTRAAVFAPFPDALPGSAREARVFRRAVGGADAHQGRRATEIEVREALAGRGMVHLATHGIMNSRNPMFSRIELAPGRGGTGDDGRLEVHELLGLRIGAPLVFLSGCETGVGTSWSTQFARGEDYATLAQAFLYAGARTVAATLWQIGDDGAAVLAERFYSHLRTMAPAEALAAAQREMLKSSRYASPYYWAGYQVIGESEPLGPHRLATLSVERK